MGRYLNYKFIDRFVRFNAYVMFTAFVIMFSCFILSAFIPHLDYIMIGAVCLGWYAMAMFGMVMVFMSAQIIVENIKSVFSKDFDDDGIL